MIKNIINYICKPSSIIIIGSVILVTRVFFISIGQYDIETDNFIIPALQNPEEWRAPYSFLWYAFNIPLTWIQIPYTTVSQSWLLYLSIIDFGMICSVRKFKHYSILYMIFSVITFRQAPYNMVILYMTINGLHWYPSLIIAPIIKLPIGGPIESWDYIFNNSMQMTTNWRYYGILIALWSIVLYKVVKDFNSKRIVKLQ